MAPEVTVYTAPPRALIELLTRSHPLHSLPLVRRLRFTRHPGGITEHSRILWSSRVSIEDHPSAATANEGRGSQGVAGKSGLDGEDGPGETPPPPFAAAYLDFSRGPETELWIYSSMEGRLAGDWAGNGEGAERVTGKEKGKTREEEEEEEEEREREREEVAAAVALLREVKRQQDLYFVPGSPRAAARELPTVLVGNLSEALKERLVAAGMAIPPAVLYDKWLFRVDELPEVRLPEAPGGGGRGEEGAKEGGECWVWDIVRPGDIPLTISRTKIPRRERTMKILPSTALYLKDGTPVGWAFLGPDSSLSSLHCEEPYRGNGIAKAVAVKALRTHLEIYDGDNYGWADVALDNAQSQGVCRSLNGKPTWRISWSRLDLDQSFPDV